VVEVRGEIHSIKQSERELRGVPTVIKTENSTQNTKKS